MDDGLLAGKNQSRRILAVASEAIGKAQLEAKLRAVEEASLRVEQKAIWSKHSFQIKEETLQKFFTYAETLGLKKYEALEEALHDFFEKRREMVEKIEKIKSGNQG